MSEGGGGACTENKRRGGAREGCPEQPQQPVRSGEAVNAEEKM